MRTRRGDRKAVFNHRRSRWLLVGLALFVCGCSDEDTVRLAKIGQLLVGKAQAAAAGANGKLANGWQAMRGDIDQFGLDARVSARLRWDKNLSAVRIDVHADGGVVTLKGVVAELAQQRKAVELAESTAGVEKVTDELQVAPKEP